MVCQAYVEQSRPGVSTTWRAPWGSTGCRSPKSSELTKNLDARVAEFRNRPVDAGLRIDPIFGRRVLGLHRQVSGSAQVRVKRVRLERTAGGDPAGSVNPTRSKAKRGIGLLARLLKERVPRVGRSDGWPPRLSVELGQNPAYIPAHRQLTAAGDRDLGVRVVGGAEALRPWESASSRVEMHRLQRQRRVVNPDPFR